MYNFIIDYYQRLSIHILWENYNALVYFYAKYIYKYVIVLSKTKMTSDMQQAGLFSVCYKSQSR